LPSPLSGVREPGANGMTVTAAVILC
jgi:hypothetical protein